MMKRLSLGCLACLSAGVWSAAPAKAPDLADAARRVRQIVAHKGASLERPENTMASYRRAIEVGATAVEIDVRTTKDGVLVSFHDATLDRTTDGKGPFAGLTLAQLKKLDAGKWFDLKYQGERIPTVREVLELCKGKADVLLDLKETGQAYAEKLAAMVRKHGDPKKTIVGVRSAEQAKRFRQLLPEARQLGLIPNPSDMEAFAKAGVKMIRIWPRWLTDAKHVDMARKLKLDIHLNGSEGSRKEVMALLQFRPESLSSDDPGRLIKTLAGLGR